MTDLTASRTVASILEGATKNLQGKQAQESRRFLTALRSLPTFVFDIARTLDEHDPDEPAKPFPRDWPYLHEMIELYEANRLLLVEKARQLMLTWLFAAVVVWEVRSKANQRWGWVSLKEGHADEALERMWAIVERMPGRSVRTQQGAKAFLDAGGVLWVRSSGRIAIPALHGNVHALSQNVDDARSFTFSGFVVDEAAFQPNFKSAYSSLKPTIDKGRFVAITTAGPFGFCYDLFHGRSYEDIA